MHRPEEMIEIVPLIEEAEAKFLTMKETTALYERGQKVVLGKILARMDKELSVRERELAAWADPEMHKYLSDWHKAELELVKARTRFDAVSNQFEALRSFFSYEREGLKRGIIA